MEQAWNAHVIICNECRGEPLAMEKCPKCKGTGAGLPSPDGLLAWMAPVDDFSLAFRGLKRTVTVILHLGLLVASIATLGFFAWRVSRLADLSELKSWAFWLSGDPVVTWFFWGLFLDCFIVFRFAVYGQDVKTLPGWGMTHIEEAEEEQKEQVAERANQRMDVSPYVSESGWQVIGAAYRLARNLNRMQVNAAHLFAACIASNTGSVFLTRLGLSFERLKEPLARLVGSGQSAKDAPVLGRDARSVLLLAYRDARRERRKYVTAVEIFLEAFLADQRLQDLLDGLGYPREQIIHVAEWIRLQDRLHEDHERFVVLAALKPSNAMNRSMTARATPLLDRFSEDLTLAARNGQLSPLVAREHEMEELLRAIESGRRSVVLVGETGSGRSALVEGLARRMVEEDIPPQLFDRRLVSVNVPQLIGAGDPSLASERLFAVLEEIGASGNIILVLHGIEALTGSGAGGPLDLAESLSAELDKGYFIAIGTTTPRAYTQYIERRTLGAKLTRVDVAPMDTNSSIRVCMAKSAGIEYRNQVFFSYAAIAKAVTLAGRYLHERALPEQALDVMREAAVLAKKRGDKSFVTGEDVASVVHDKTNVPVEAVSEDESQKLLGLEDRLHTRIIGQELAVTAVAQAMRRARAELREGKRPIANFLFLGPTGVGKTELSKALALEYFGSEAAMVRLDMSEYQDEGSAARMIGNAGDERGGLLTEAVRKTPFTIVLLDEIEKAHPDILNLFLQVMDDGRLTDGVGRTIDFTNVVLIATSNAGTSFIQDQVKQGVDVERIKMMLMEQELKGTFRPEFLNRFDAIIVFKPLTIEDVTRIAGLLLQSVASQLERKGIRFRAEEAAVAKLAELGYDPAFGARPLRRVIQDKVENGLADIILRNAAKRRDTVVVRDDLSLIVEKGTEF
jgi:ATP-dependent Clp protease ATP-binding subunit ClpC